VCLCVCVSMNDTCACLHVRMYVSMRVLHHAFDVQSNTETYHNIQLASCIRNRRTSHRGNKNMLKISSEVLLCWFTCYWRCQPQAQATPSNKCIVAARLSHHTPLRYTDCEYSLDRRQTSKVSFATTHVQYCFASADAVSSRVNDPHVCNTYSCINMWIVSCASFTVGNLARGIRSLQ
jgi:hypothetical protein